MHDGGEAELRRRFAVREERFEHGGWAADLVVPRAADELIDEAEFADGERIPYWAELWPSARALARHLLENPPADGAPVLELGSGVALPSLALRSLGVPALATDWYPDALRFAEANAARNGLAPLPTALLDWRHPPSIPRHARIIAADVLYESRNAALLSALLPRIALPGATLLLADPGRAYAPAFLRTMEAAGWLPSLLAEREEPSAPFATSLVRIHLLTAPP